MSGFTIGILGGMGPRATVYFEQKLLEKLEGPDQILPKIIVVNDGSIPDRTAFLRGHGQDPLPALRRCARALLAQQPDVVCVPCNTAHADGILGQLQAELNMPLIDMPAAAIEQAVLLGHARLLVLGTEGTKLADIYDSRASGATIIYPTAAAQERINTLITGTKHQGFAASNQAVLADIIGTSDCDAAILACTELSILNQGPLSTMPVIDALEALVDATIAAMDASYAITES